MGKMAMEHKVATGGERSMDTKFDVRYFWDGIARPQTYSESARGPIN